MRAVCIFFLLFFSPLFAAEWSLTEFEAPQESGELFLTEGGAWFSFTNESGTMLWNEGDLYGPFQKNQWSGRLVIDEETQIGRFYFISNSQRYIQVENLCFGPFSQNSTPIFDGRNFAFWAQNEEGTFVHLPYEDFSGFESVAELTFSEGEILFSAKKDDGDYLVASGLEEGPYERIYSGFFRSSGVLYFCYAKGDEIFVSFGEESFGPYQSVSFLSENGFAYRKNENWFIYTPQQKFGPYDYVESLSFSDESPRFSYQKDGLEYYYAKGSSSAGYSKIEILSDFGNGFFAGMEEGRTNLFTLHQDFGIYDEVPEVFAQNEDGTLLVAAVKNGGESFLLTNDFFEEIFTPEGVDSSGEESFGLLSFEEPLAILWDERKHWIAVHSDRFSWADGEHLFDEVISFEEDGRTTAFEVVSDGETFVYHDGEEYGPFNDIWKLTVWDNDVYVSAQVDETNRMIRNGGEILSDYYWADSPSFDEEGRIYFQFVSEEGKFVFYDDEIFGPFEKLYLRENSFAGLSGDTIKLYRCR